MADTELPTPGIYGLKNSGPLLTGEKLWRSLGFSSSAAFRQAKMRGQIEIRIFRIPNRRGNFAYTQDVIAWLYGLERNDNAQKTNHS